MTRRLLTVLAILVVVVAGCSSDDSGDDAAALPTDQVSSPGEVAGLGDGTHVVAQGVLVIDTEAARLCDGLAESFPPQCAGGFIELNDLDEAAVVGLEFVEQPAIKWTNYPLTVSGTVDGGALVGTEVAGTIYETEANGLRVRLYPAQRPFPAEPLRSGESVWWAIDATNVTEQGIPLTFGSAQVAEVTISDGDTELYRWSDGKSFAQVVHELDFEAGHTAGATLNDPLVVEPGSDYTLRAWITGVGAENVVVSIPVDVVQN
jgi:Intracellular proteinase inhibitor